VIVSLICRWSRGTLQKQRNADDSDIGRPAGVCSVGSASIDKIECGDFRVALAPTGYFVALASAQDIAALSPRAGLAADYIDSINGHYRKNALAAMTLNHD
jgi:hypothetical protein